MLLFYGLKFSVCYFWGKPMKTSSEPLCPKLSRVPPPTLYSSQVRLTLVPVHFHPKLYRICADLVLGYTDTFLNCCIFKSIHSGLHIISNIYVCMIVFIVSVRTGGENVAIFLRFQMKGHLKMHLCNQSLNLGFK